LAAEEGIDVGGGGGEGEDGGEEGEGEEETHRDEEEEERGSEDGSWEIDGWMEEGAGSEVEGSWRRREEWKEIRGAKGARR